MPVENEPFLLNFRWTALGLRYGSMAGGATKETVECRRVLGIIIEPECPPMDIDI